MRQLRGLNLGGEFAYPVRSQINRAIIYTDPQEMMADSKYRGTLFEKLEQLETAIIRGQAIEIYRSRNAYHKGVLSISLFALYNSFIQTLLGIST
jgi:hypothetical protein